MYIKVKLDNIAAAIKLPNAELNNLLGHPASKILTGEQATKLKKQQEAIAAAMEQVEKISKELEF